MLITVEVPDGCGSVVTTAMLREHPDWTLAEATAEVIRRTLGAWATVRVEAGTRVPATSTTAAKGHGFLRGVGDPLSCRVCGRRSYAPIHQHHLGEAPRYEDWK